MLTYIYRSEKKTDCYLYLDKPAASADLPMPVKKVVALNEQGFYIQMPSKEPHPVDVLFDKLFD